MLLRLENIDYTLGGKNLLKQANFSLYKEDRIAVTGRNGSGKSTFLKIAAGLIEPNGGEVFQPSNVKISYLEQIPSFGEHTTARSYLESDFHFEDDLYLSYSYAQDLGLTLDKNLNSFSEGEKRRLALVKILAIKPDILLLDEPTNHLDIHAIEWLETRLNSLSSALVVISHDRRFLENTTKAILWLDRGQLRKLDKSFSDFESWRDQHLYEEEIAQHKLARKIVREEHWVKYGVSARRKRNLRRLDELKKLRVDHRSYEKKPVDISFTVGETRSKAKLIIDAEHIYKSYGERCLVKDFSLRIHQKDRVGFIGKNGIGKTTLLKTLIGEIAPDQGSVKLAYQLEIVYLDQKRTIDENQTLKDYLTDKRGETLIVHDQERHVYSYMKDFLFQENQASTLIKNLSGGERARLILARLFTKSSDLLVLDEPTNDLDLETLDVLEQMINSYKGTVLLISHDRDFLDRVVDYSISPSLMEFEKTIWHVYSGGYSAMKQQQALALDQIKRSEKEKMKKEIKSSKSSLKERSKTEKPRKLSYHQKYALENLPKEIELLTKQIEELEFELSQMNYDKEKVSRFDDLVQQLAQKQSLKSQKENEWLEFELLREEIEKG